MKSLSRVQLFATPWTVAYQAFPSMGFSRQEYWSGMQIINGLTCPAKELELPTFFSLVAIVYIPRAGTTSYYFCLASTMRGASRLAPIKGGHEFVCPKAAVRSSCPHRQGALGPRETSGHGTRRQGDILHSGWCLPCVSGLPRLTALLPHPRRREPRRK